MQGPSYMNNQGPLANSLQPMHPYVSNNSGTLSIWDDPSIQGGIVHPEGHKHLTLMSMLERIDTGYFDELDMMILKVLGDAIAVNENQLKRYMETKTTRSQVSLRLKKLRTYSLVNRWEISSDIYPVEGEHKPSAPYTIGISGFSLLKQFYHSQFFMAPHKWNTQGLSNMQRFVATNEIRCQLVEEKKLCSWKWNPLVLNNPEYKRPLAVAEVRTPQGKINFIIDRVQQGRDYVGYLKTKIEQWVKIQAEGFPFSFKHISDRNPCVFIIYVSNKKIAEKIASEIVLENKPIPLWFCIEEDLVKEDLSKAFYKPISNGEITKLQTSFLLDPQKIRYARPVEEE